jgi:hypothetical protein
MLYSSKSSPESWCIHSCRTILGFGAYSVSVFITSSATKTKAQKAFKKQFKEDTFIKKELHIYCQEEFKQQTRGVRHELQMHCMRIQIRAKDQQGSQQMSFLLFSRDNAERVSAGPDQ